MSALTSLDLSHCRLQGEFPASLAKRTKLVDLDLSDNRLSGELPTVIGDFGSLEKLNLYANKFSGQLPPSIGNLRSLKQLDLSSNEFSGQLPTSMGNLSSLQSLDVKFCNFWGKIPPSLGNLTQLSFLYLDHNGFLGELPASFENLNSLATLSLSHCNLSGRIPHSLSNLTQLDYLDLSSNNFSGRLEIDTFLLLKSLRVLILSSNKVSLLSKVASDSTLWTVLLGSCNLVEFPNFLQNQHQLKLLDLSVNNISGQIPQWLLNSVSIQVLNLSHNFLTGFDGHPVFLPASDLIHLDLSFNKLQGPLPRPNTNIMVYQVSNNKLTGEIPTWICDLTELYVLDLSYNNLSGMLPRCLGNSSYALEVLKLRGNDFSGRIPKFMHGTNLRMIDLNDNLFQGRIPRSLANCTYLQFLDLGNNQINDTFPSWLGTLPLLNVLILQSSRFHGVIREAKSNCSFPELRIIDLSHNRFIGKLPSKYFQCWKAIIFVNASQLTYLQAGLPVIPGGRFGFNDVHEIYDYSLKMSSKGRTMAYDKIPEFLTSVILSGNKFDGEIPKSIANLKGLQNLNLSNNNLQGHIPSFLGNLTNMESLDLSNNQFSGQIPQQLAELTFLGYFDVSNNHLTGPIPQGKQFDTFENGSFDENWGLCGKPLSTKCENNFETPTNKEIQDSESPFALDWKIILIGYTGGLVVGVVLGLSFSTKIQGWLWEKFGRQSKRTRRNRRRRN